MTFTIEFGWWLLPLAITLFLVCGSLVHLSKSDGWDMMAPLGFFMSIIISLAAWLVWAVLT